MTLPRRYYKCPDCGHIFQLLGFCKPYEESDGQYVIVQCDKCIAELGERHLGEDVLSTEDKDKEI